MPPKRLEKKTFNLWPIFALILTLAVVALVCFYGAKLFLDISWLASLGSSRNVSVVLFRVGLVPVFAFVFASLAVVHSWLGSSRERQNRAFLLFKFFFFFTAVCIGEGFLRISESLIYAVLAGFTGINDSLFGIDMAWYLLWIPLIKNISLFLTCYFILLFFFRISYPGDHKKISYGKASLCLFSLFSIIFLLVAYSQYLSDRRTLSSDTFLGYSDIFGRVLPLAASLIWTWIFLTLSLYFFRRRYRVLLTGSVLTFIVLLACNVIWPFYLEKFILEPNKISYQNKYAGIHAENTRKAFGLDTLTVGGDNPDSEEKATGLQNIFLLDRNIFVQQLQNTKNLTGALTFLDASPAILEEKPYYIAPRTLSSRTDEWELRHFRNIYGYGAVIASASHTDKNGGPAYDYHNAKGDVPLDNPEIFFDESFDTFAFINTKMELPGYEKDALSEKTFPGVESIGLTFLHKLALSVSQRDFRPLFTKYYTPDTKLIYYRKPSELAKKILPFFDYSTPKPAYFNRTLWWEMDGYISSQNVFVAASVQTPWGMKNWLRAPIRVYVNAHTGEVFFHRINGTDPMVKVISKVFPQLFTKPINPDSVSYPDTLFAVQSKLLERYHETNDGAFYAGVNTRTLSGEAEPVLLTFSERKMIGLAQNFSQQGKGGLAARLTAHIDAGGKPSLRLFENLGENMSVDQAAEAMRASTEFQNLRAYWRNLEIIPQLGNLVSKPYAGGVIYLRPIYTNSAALGMPLLAKVAAVQGTQVYLADTPSELAAMLNIEAGPAAVLDAQQLLERTIREAYLDYLEAEKSRVQGKPQDYQKNVDKIGEKLRRALN